MRMRQAAVSMIGVLAAVGTFPYGSSAQKEIPFSNPSFEEDSTFCCRAPRGWYNCGAPDETPPDVQPGYFEVTKLPKHGRTYLGLVVRDNETTEAVGQRLARPLEANECYEFSADLCRSELYISLSRTTGQQVNYATPVVLRIWGGNSYCAKNELLYETNVITTTRWLTYTFRLHPKKSNHTYLMLEAFYKTPTLFPYNGNILVDNLSPIRQVECNMPAMPDVSTSSEIVMVKKGEDTSKAAIGSINSNKPSKPNTPSVVTVSTPSTPSVEPISRGALRKGATFQLSNLYFDVDKYQIKEECIPALETVYKFLMENPDVVIEVGGHTNNLPSEEFARTLSTDRARAVAEWLIRRGVPKERVQYKGYGKTQPIDTNLTPEGRKRNQRVEFKILSMNN